MVARVARFEGINVAEAQAMMGEAEAIVRPIVEGMQGFAGRLDLVTREGDFLSVTFFDSDADAEASEQTFDEELPKRLGPLYERMGGRRVAVGVYQVVSDVRK
jgi:hypothetical protein